MLAILVLLDREFQPFAALKLKEDLRLLEAQNGMYNELFDFLVLLLLFFVKKVLKSISSIECY